MRNLKFHYVKATNILCFGPNGIELNFDDYGNVVQIQGVNLDNPGTEDDPASNGAGKSSIQELVSIGLFGRTVKDPTKNKGADIINVDASSGVIEIQWDDCRVVRTFKRSGTTGSITSKLQAWENEDHIWDTEITKGAGKDETQDWIIRKIGLNHDSFCRVSIFDDSNAYSFLGMDGPTKREFVENLLGLDKYRQYHENAKDYLREQKRLVENMGRDYQQLQTDVADGVRRSNSVAQQEKTWQDTRQRSILDIEKSIRDRQQKLANTDVGSQLTAWQNAQDKIVELRNKVDSTKGKRSKIQEVIKFAREKLETARLSKNTLSESVQSQQLGINSIQSDIDKHLDLIQELESLQIGTRCPTCHGIISRDNFGNVLEHSQNCLESARNKSQTQQLILAEEKIKLSEKTAAVVAMNAKIEEAETKVIVLDNEITRNQQEIANLTRIPKPDNSGAFEAVLEAEIVSLKKQLASKVAESSPYTEIIQQAAQEHGDKVNKTEVKAKELEAAEKEIPYYEFWVFAFSDRGIRKYIIDGIIPALNTRTEYWLRYLIDNKIGVVFNNELDTEITRNGKPVSYHNMSNGERRKVNLAISQAWAYIRMLNSGSCPSIVFLDEITGGGIDRASIVGIYNMVFELAKERQVFVTTHNETLISMLQGCETIRLKKQNDVTVLVA